jgi:hypothetical protein
MSQSSMPTEEKSGPSGWAALGTVLTDPWKTFASFGERPPILPGYLVQMILALFPLLMTMGLALDLAAQQVASQGLPPVAGVAKMGAIIGMVIGGVASPWIAGLFVSLIALLWGRAESTPVQFGGYFGMVGFARLPVVIGGFLQGLLLMNAQSIADLQNKSISVAVLLPTDASPYLKAFATTLNPFDFWYYLLLAMGFAALHKRPAIKGVGLAVTVYGLSLLFTVVSAGWGIGM